ncbi:7660_t:CDS:2 [Scutellospora calospora]|uniref:7660_t:CDS:1 n=1 Tax=Scutellospora calospora TaxID=85575 RepID=A0ACA9LBB9_9GLOM|nr:7660_t:CDS:2 [Scutellospora calospora]
MEKRPQNSQYDTLYEVKQYLDKHLVPKAMNILKYVASEQIFSCAGHIIDNNHTSLDLSIITTLMC